MKNNLLFLFLVFAGLCFPIISRAYDSSNIDYRNGLLTINIPTAGSLSTIIEGYDLTGVKKVKLAGYINGDDVNVWWKVLENATYIDLSDVEVKAGGHYYTLFYYDTHHEFTTFENEISFDMLGVGSNVETLKLPRNITACDQYFLTNDINLTKLYVYSQTPPANVNRNGSVSNLFGDGISKSKITLYVPKGSVDAYKADNNWGGFGNIVANECSDGSSTSTTDRESAITDDINAHLSSSVYWNGQSSEINIGGYRRVSQGVNYSVTNNSSYKITITSIEVLVNNNSSIGTIFSGSSEVQPGNSYSGNFSVSGEGYNINLPLPYLKITYTAGGNTYEYYTNKTYTGIDTVSTDVKHADSKIYNLRGIQMSEDVHLAPGIYIKNGKKFVVK